MCSFISPTLRSYFSQWRSGKVKMELPDGLFLGKRDIRKKEVELEQERREERRSTAYRDSSFCTTKAHETELCCAL